MKIIALVERLATETRASIVQALAPILHRLSELEKSFLALPAAEKGDKGDKGDPGERGKDADMDAVARMVDERIAAEVEKRVAALPKPKDGESVHKDTIALMVRDAAMMLTGALPKPLDGKDGFGLEDFQVEMADDGRTLTFRFLRGELKKEHQIRIPAVLDRGVYRPEAKYEKGDGVTFGGSWWLAQVDHPTDKPGLSEQWRLAVKRGRDGKDTK